MDILSIINQCQTTTINSRITTTHLVTTTTITITTATKTDITETVDIAETIAGAKPLLDVVFFTFYNGPTLCCLK